MLEVTACRRESIQDVLQDLSVMDKLATIHCVITQNVGTILEIVLLPATLNAIFGS